MAITSTGYQAPATSRQGLKPSVYDKIILIGADVDPRLAGQGIFYAIEKDIAAQAYTPEIYAARLKQRGFSDESAQAFTQAYIQKDINIAKDWANGKAAEVYENNVRTQVAAEIKAKNEIEGEGWTMRDGGEANLEIYEGNGVIDFSSKIDDDFLRANATELEPSSNLFDFLAKTKNNPSRDKILNHFADKAGERDSKALDHRMAYLNYIMPTIEEPLIKIFRPDGRISNIKPFVFTDVNSKTKNVNFLSIVTDKDGNIDFITAYALKDKSQLRSEIKKGIKVEVRRGLARTFDPHSRVQVPSATGEIISQKGNLVNEAETNGLSDGVSSIGDNASRAGGRQASDEQILRQGRRDTANASQTKRPAQSDEQVEQPGAAKADGQADAAAATKQVVEKQGSGASIGGEVAANSNAHLGSGLVAGTLNSVDEDGNFSPERFAAGFLAGLVGGKAAAVGLRKMTPKLYNKILGAAEKMPQMANGNPRLLGKLYSNGKDVSLNSFAGQKAITANVGKLDQAKAMLEKGADEVEIWQKTGWFKDKDGAWKFEIGDGKAKLNPNFQSGGRLGELLEHEELFKAYPELKDISVKKIGDDIPDSAALSVKNTAQREKRGIYNVAYNDKSATLVRRDLEKIDDALMFEKGSSKKGGAIHVKKHLEPEAQGAITQSELLNIGKNIREYLQKYKEPFIDEHGGRIYEWANKEGVKFRVVVYEKTDGISASHPETIISFYSNRNLKKPMEFRNPEVKYDVNLRQWHKDSVPITKNADGSPKVFYHGSKAKDITEFKDKFDKTGVGFWFSPNKNTADEYGDTLSVYLKAKKIMDFAEPTKKDTEVLKLIQEKMFWSGHIKLRETNNEPLFRVMLDIFRKNGVELKQLLKERGYDGIRVNKDMFVVFDSAQIKHVKNNGNFSDSPNIYKSGKEGYYSPANNEIGLSDLGDKSTLMHEVQHAIQEIEGFAKGSSEKGESYRLSHGEAEARNVQNRLNLGGDTHPYETFDANPNKTIVSKGGEVSYSRKIEEIKSEHPNVEKELDESIATMRKESFNDSNFKAGLIGKFDTKEITTQQLGKSINLSNKQLTILKNDIKNADFKVINESKIYFDKVGKDGDKKRFFIDIAEDGNVRVDAYAKSQINSIPIKENALQELAGVGDRARLKNMSFEVKAAYFNELDPIKKEAILKTAELNKLKKAAQSGDKVAVAKFEEFKAKNLDKDGSIKDGLRLC